MSFSLSELSYLQSVYKNDAFSARLDKIAKGHVITCPGKQGCSDMHSNNYMHFLPLTFQCFLQERRALEKLSCL